MSDAGRVSRRACAGLLLASGGALALGRTPYGGALRLSVPWSPSRLDPHVLDDPIAALFAGAVCDPLYALDGAGRPYPALAAALPEPAGAGVRVRLRPGVVSAANKPITAADVVFSVDRAIRQGSAAWLFGGPPPRADRRDPLIAHFSGVAPADLALALANPLTAIVPRGYSATQPDGTGAFSAELQSGRLVLARNPSAARGPAFLDRIEVRTAADLADALREFEAGNADVGWLGAGLHRPRAGAVGFRGALLGFAVLRPGRLAAAWGAPGVMQQLIDGIDPSRLRHLGLEGLPAAATSSASWRGGPIELRVSEEAPQLVLVARTLAAALGSAGNEIGAVPTPRSELERRRRSGDFGLMVDFVRALGVTGPMTQRALLAAQDPELARKPPRIDAFEARRIGRSVSLGVIGELWAAGAHMPRFQSLAGWQLGGVYRLPEPA